MRKLIFSLSFVLLVNLVSAQISDEEARQIYQDAEEAYEGKDYYSASLILDDLSTKMGKKYEGFHMKAWRPKTLYLYLMCIYKNYTESEQTSKRKYALDYKNLSSFFDLCTDFLMLASQPDYPKDKSNDIVVAQAYFKEMMEKYSHQKGRTPERAISFLNDCGLKFGGNYLGLNRSRDQYGSSAEHSKVVFQLVGSYLKITTFNDPPPFVENGILTFKGRIDIFDLSKVTSLVQGLRYGDYVPVTPNGFATYQDGEKVSAYMCYKDITLSILTSKKDKEGSRIKYDNTLKQFRVAIDSTASVPDFVDFKRYKLTDDSYSKDYARQIDFLDYFCRCAYRRYSDGSMGYQHSEEFNDIYKVRITEAIQYLIDYFPKAKPQIEKRDGF